MKSFTQNFASGFVGIARMNIERIFRIWSQTLFPPMITTVLYILVFGFSLGSQISQMQGVSYVEFIIPGLMMMSVITGAYMHTAFSFFIMRIQKSIEEILVAPVSNAEVVCGFVVGSILRAILVAILIMGVGILMADVTIENFWIVFILLVLTAVAFALFGLLNAVFAKTFDGVNFIPTFVLTPLTFLGGVFYSLEVLPLFWQKVALANPVYWIISGFRQGFYGVSEIPLALPILSLIIISVILFCICLHLVSKSTNLRS